MTMRRALELLKVVLALVTVLGMTVLMLAALDAVPRALQPQVERLATVPSVEAAEKRLGEKLAMPSYFPESLAWPPSQVRIARGDPPTVSISLLGRDGGGTRVLLCQTVGAEGAVSADLLPRPSRVLDSRKLQVAGAPGSLARVETPDGLLWHDLGWSHSGQQFVLRTRGTVTEALMMAESVRRPR